MADQLQELAKTTLQKRLALNRLYEKALAQAKGDA